MSASRRTLIAVVCLLAIAAIAAVAFRFAPGSRAAQPKSAPAVPVNVAPVVTKSVPVRLRAIGNVEPYTTVAVKARIDGQIVAVHFKEGQEVRKGETLFEIDRRPFEAQLAQAQANLGKDRAVLDHANEQEKRYKELLEQKFVSPDAYAQIRTNAVTAAAQLRADEAAIESARLQIGYCTIRSPITGYAGKIQIQEGNLVKANDTISLVVINQVVPINVSFSVPEQSLAAVRKYQADGELQVSAQVPSGGLAPVAGKLSFIDNSTDASTGTIKLKAEFANTDKALWPGQFVDVILTLTHQDNAIVVPATAVQNGPSGQYVFVVKPDHSVEVRNIRVGRSEGDIAVMASGLKPGETVVTVGQLRLAPGTKITIADAKASE
ncbi:MAG TPA: efflux RND transporter periplasmic adaptor subunit [Casimicrobiaceae bacterium]|nr:efflux RND transporter periplasmic adaptor subunit [Casimicrobiaceae bacterium]